MKISHLSWKNDKIPRIALEGGKVGGEGGRKTDSKRHLSRNITKPFKNHLPMTCKFFNSPELKAICRKKKLLCNYVKYRSSHLTFSSYKRDMNIPKPRPTWIWTAWDSSAFGFPGNLSVSILRTSSIFSLHDTTKIGTRRDKAVAAQDRAIILAVFSPE